MTVDDLSTPLRQLIACHLPSVDYAEVLLAVCAERQDNADVACIAAEVCLDQQTCQGALDDFVAAGLVAVTNGGFRIKATSDQRAVIEELQHVYDEFPITLVRAMQARPWPVKSFADAFRTRKDPGA